MSVTERKKEKVKIIFVGSCGVGKTCIIRKFVENSFNENSLSSEGMSSYENTIEINDKKIICDIWDTAGQEQYRSICTFFYKGSSVACLVYDITNKKTFEDIKEVWLPDLEENGENDVIKIIVGNKCDLYEDEEIPEQEVRKYAEENNINLFLVSAKHGDGIKELFDEIAKKYLEIFFGEKIEKKNTFKIDDNRDENDKNQKEKKKRKCCHSST